MWAKLLNFIVFQLGWIIAVYWHNNAAALVCLCLAILNFKPYTRINLLVLVVGADIALLGAGSDYVLLQLGVISFPGQEYILLPAWLAVLWLLFVSTFASSLDWIQTTKIRTQAIMGGFGGAFSYIAGAEIGAMQPGFATIPQFIIHFIVWFFMFPALYYLYTRLTTKLNK